MLRKKSQSNVANSVAFTHGIQFEFFKTVQSDDIVGLSAITELWGLFYPSFDNCVSHISRLRITFEKSKSNTEKLESIDKKIKVIEDFKLNTQIRQKKVVAAFLLYSCALYMVVMIIIYFYFYPKRLQNQFFYLISLASIPLLLYFMKNFLTWYYDRKVISNQSELAKLKEAKEELIEDIKTTETYSKVKEILKKFAPDHFLKESNEEMGLVRAASNPNLSFRSENNNNNNNVSRRIPDIISTPLLRDLHTRNNLSSRKKLLNDESQSSSRKPTLTLQTPYPVLTPTRSAFDKLIDLLVGDGPSNRYALICKNCFNHNGMALKEDFEYVSFRCCYCFVQNPAKKQRPSGPKLDPKPELLPLDLEDADLENNGKNADSFENDTNKECEKNVENVLPDESNDITLDGDIVSKVKDD